MEKMCSVCGQPINEQAVICPHCGCIQDEKRFNEAFAVQNTLEVPTAKAEEANLVLKILSAVLPLVGLILFAVNYTDKRHIANVYGIWALCGVAIRINLYIYLYIFYYALVFLALGWSVRASGYFI